MIDWNRPVQTRRGDRVHILCTDSSESDWPVQGYVAGSNELHKWTADGWFFNDGYGDPYDLVNVPGEKEPLIVGEMYVQSGESDGRTQFELVQAIEVTDDIRDLLTEAGYDTSELY